MATWREFETSAPALAGLGKSRWEKAGLFLIGTLRKDGSVRISPCEYLVFEDELWLGMMWQSKKALDLVRDQRITIHSAVSNKDGKDGEFKVYGRVIDERDTSRRTAFGAFSEAETGFKPSEPYHLFRLAISEAAFVVFGPEGKAEVEAACAGPAVESPEMYDPGDGSGHTVLHWRER